MPGYMVVPEDTHVLISGAYECYLTGQRNSADVTKLRNLRCRELAWLFGQTQYHPPGGSYSRQIEDR